MKEMVDVKCIFISREKEKMVPAAFTFFFFCFREGLLFNSAQLLITAAACKAVKLEAD